MIFIINIFGLGLGPPGIEEQAHSIAFKSAQIFS